MTYDDAKRTGVLFQVYIVFIIVGIIAGLFAWCFLMAAGLTFATFDPQPVDRETDRLLTAGALLGSGMLVWGYIVTRQWARCPLGRRLAYTGLAFGVLTFALCWLGMSLGVWNEHPNIVYPARAVQGPTTNAAAR